MIFTKNIKRVRTTFFRAGQKNIGICKFWSKSLLKELLFVPHQGRIPTSFQGFSHFPGEDVITSSRWFFYAISGQVFEKNSLRVVFHSLAGGMGASRFMMIFFEVHLSFLLPVGAVFPV